MPCRLRKLKIIPESGRVCLRHFGRGRYGRAGHEDRPVWTMSINLQIYSNYRGRKDVAQKLETTFCRLVSPDGREALNTSLNTDGFNLVDLTVGAVSISLPIVGDAGEWQNGSID